MLVAHLFRNFIFSRRAGALVRRIAWLSILGVGLSVTAFLVVLFVMNGMNGSIKKRIIGLEPQLNITVAGITSAAALEGHPVMQRVREEPLNKAYVFESQDVIVRTQDGQFRGGIARGVSRESLEYMIQQLQKMDQTKNKSQIDAGFTWNPEEIPGAGEVVMGVDLAQTLGVFEGDFVTIVSPEGLLLPPGESPKFERVRISRIVATSLADIDSQYIFYQRGLALTAISQGYSKKIGIEVFAPESVNIANAAQDFVKFDGVQVETWMERNAALFYALKLEKTAIGVILALSGIISSISIVTVLVLLLSQKRRDIAILRTIGLSAKQTVKMFTQMGMMLAGAGLIAGTILGTAISFYIQEFPINFLPAEVYYDSQIPAQVDFLLVVGVLLFGSLIAWGGAYVPAKSAIATEPSQALRSK